MRNINTVKDQPYTVLFICRGNSARSVMAEAVLNDLGAGRFRAYSAGSSPAGRINPFALDLLSGKGFPTSELRSKSWDEFAAEDAPQMDFIVTLCDNAAGETCPIWPGHPPTAHWGFEDPAAHPGPDAEKRHMFEKIFLEITARIRLFLALPLEKLDRMSLLNEVRAIGRTTRA
ncbi:MAG: arsenate reductase ArsC [Acidobacteriales bacterium]|nr:arsenate reductase ArsC [Terriglobales bacterium]